MTELSRRAVLSTGGRAAVATLALGGVSVAATDPIADAELLRLEGEFGPACDRWLELSDVWNQAQERVFAACSQSFSPPDYSSMPEDIRDQFEQLSFREMKMIQEVAPNHPYAIWQRENGEARRAALVRDHRERERIAEALGEPEADAAQGAQMDRVNELTDEILAIRATSLTGIMVKLRLRKWDDGSTEEILNSIEDDVRAMAGEPLRTS